MASFSSTHVDDNLRTEIALSIEEAIRSPLEDIRVAMGKMVQVLRSLHVANERRRQRDESSVEEEGCRRPRDKRREVLKSQSDEKRKVYDYTRTQSAKAYANLPAKKVVKHACLKDAILHALELEKNQFKQKEQSSCLQAVHLEENKFVSVVNQSQVCVPASYKDVCEHNFEDYYDFLEPDSPLDALQSEHMKQSSWSTMPRNNLDYTGTSFERQTALQAAQHIYESKDGHCHYVSVISDNLCSNLPEDMDDKSFLHLDSHVEESTLTDFTPVYSSSSTNKFHTYMVGRSSNFPIEGQVILTSTEKIKEFRHSTSVVGSKSTLILPYACACGAVNSQWHKSPLEQCNASAKSDTNLCNSENSISGPFMRQSYISKGQSVSEESTTRARARPMPLPCSVEKVPLLRKSVVCSSGPLPSLQVEPSSKSGPISRCPKSCIYVSPKTSLSLSPHHLSPPRISELHELPRPPDKRYILGVVETFLDAVPLFFLMSDAGPVIDMMAMTLEKLSTIAVPARVTIGAMLILAHIIASISDQSYIQQGLLEALFHQLLQAMVHPDIETCVTAHHIFVVLLVPTSISPQPESLLLQSDSWYDTKKTLSKSTSAFVFAAALFEKLRREKDAIRKSPTRLYSMNNSIPDMKTISSSPKDTEMCAMRLSADQAAQLLPALWIQANLPDNMPANFEAIAHPSSLTFILPPSRCKSLFTLATARLLADDLLLNVRIHTNLKECGSLPDDRGALSSLSTVRLSEEESNEALVNIIVRSLSTMSDLEGSAIEKELSETFSPDDVFAFGPRLLLESGHGPKPGIPKDSLSFDKTSVPAALPHIISVGQLLESALEATGQVASAAVLTSPLPFSAMANQCEAFGASTRNKMPVWMNQDANPDTLLLTFPVSEESERTIVLQNYENNGRKVVLMDKKNNQGIDKILSSNCLHTGTLPHEPWQTMQFPAASPYDNF
eukprot:Gb_37556 [translate_table: standard]